MLAHETRTLLGVTPRCAGRRRHEHFDIVARRHPEHAETKPAAEITIACIALAALAAGRQPRRNPDLVTGAGPVDGLQQQFEIEGLLEFADHHDRRLVAL
jgi:hypothetical protein